MLIGAAAAAALVLGVVLVAALGGGGPKGMGTFDLAVRSGPPFVTHAFEVPDDSVVLIEVDPSEDFDPDLGVSAETGTARALARYLDDAGFDRSRFTGVFSDYGYDTDGMIFVGRVDEGAAGDRERLLVTAPEGGRFEVVVAAADESDGAFELEVSQREYPADDDGVAYLEDLVDAGFVERFLSDEALEDLATSASIELGFQEGEDLEEDPDGDAEPDLVVPTEEGIAGEQLQCISDDLAGRVEEDRLAELAELAGSDPLAFFAAPEVQEAMSACGAQPTGGE